MAEEIKKETATPSKKTNLKSESETNATSEQLDKMAALLQQAMEELKNTRAENAVLRVQNNQAYAPVQVIRPEELRVKIYCSYGGINVMWTRDGRKSFKFVRAGQFHRVNREVFDELFAQQQEGFEKGLFCVDRAGAEEMNLFDDYPEIKAYGEIKGMPTVKEFEDSKKMTHDQLSRYFLNLSKEGQKAFANDWLVACAENDKECLIRWKLDILGGAIPNHPQIQAMARKADELTNEDKN